MIEHGRLIDADTLIKDVLDLQNCYNGFSDTYDKACIIGLIDEQPTIKPEREWIPCSERLPETDGYYLVTNSKWGAPWREITLWMTDGWQSNNNPIAWMPLPEPYKEIKR